MNSSPEMTLTDTNVQETSSVVMVSPTFAGPLDVDDELLLEPPLLPTAWRGRAAAFSDGYDESTENTAHNNDACDDTRDCSEEVLLLRRLRHRRQLRRIAHWLLWLLRILWLLIGWLLAHNDFGLLLLSAAKDF